ncbi:hypothetical protein [Haloechinothrix halophila]|uniref:Uncharacterized protein n=1 Tax=Haloechinothrix halophila YIM 93223 TaxID=592678 RepID=W9DRJ5_9PSEU|nr:hypothetical protein [Haloechinothrix halophila]ETA66282.1 hypothetical protein AmyhaDRAFT_0035 [Haloechinothrix halophila YIM 93223]
MRLTVAITVLIVAMLTGNAVFIVAAVIGAIALMATGSSQWARFRASLHAPAAGNLPTGALPPDDDPDFLRWLTERNQRQHGDDAS